MSRETIKLFISGDVMTGRGIDQVLPHPNEPRIYEPYVSDARDYITLAERRLGRIPNTVNFDYIWGDALTLLEQEQPRFRVVNLETAVTDSDDHWPDKGIHYRMHPANGPCLNALGIQCCALANNHLLDWGYDGLAETLAVLRELGIVPCGAGHNREAARQPARLFAGDRRLSVFSVGLSSSGIPAVWEATGERAGVYRLPDLSAPSLASVIEVVEQFRQADSYNMVSIHWGGNWGYDISAEQRHFARALIDAGVDLVHGHSSHHPIGMECYRGHLICYGCGDLINDYEGIRGHEAYRPHLALMYLPLLGPQGELRSLKMFPLEIKGLRLQQATEKDAAWLAQRLDRESHNYGLRVELSCLCEHAGGVGETWLEGIPQ